METEELLDVGTKQPKSVSGPSVKSHLSAVFFRDFLL